MIYEISSKYQMFLDMVGNEEIPDEALSDTLEALDGEVIEKIDEISCIYKNIQAEAEAIDAEMKALKERAEYKKVKADNMKTLIHKLLDVSGMQKIETARNKISIAKCPPSVEIDNLDDFVKYAQVNADNLLRYKQPEPDKTAIKEALNADTEIPYCRMVKDKLRLNIK